MRALLSAPGSRRVALAVAALLAGAALIATLRAPSSARVSLHVAGLMLAPSWRSALWRGGGASLAQLLGGFLTLNLSESHHPSGWLNVVEASSTLNWTPLILLLVLVRCLRGGRAERVELVLLGFAAAMALYCVCGVPDWLARATLWSYVSTNKLIVPMAVVSTLLLIRYLSVTPPGESVRTAVFTAAIGAPFFVAGLLVANHELHDFVPRLLLVAIAAYFTTAGLMIAMQSQVAAFALILTPILFFNSMINPISRGIPAYSRTAISPAISHLAHANPNRRWAVFGDTSRAAVVSSIFTATGVPMLTGTSAVPDLRIWRKLDPTGAQRTIYARYAHVALTAATAVVTAPIFHLAFTDSIRIEVPPAEEWLQKLEVGGVVLVDQPGVTLPIGFRDAATVGGCRFAVRE